MDRLTARGEAAPPDRKAGRWVVRWRPQPHSRLRLFCVPYAGGGAAIYRQWAQRLTPRIEVVAIRLPGRENRFGEPTLHRVADITTALMTELDPWLDRPHAWFGHSLGALIAFETCRALSRTGRPAPVRLLVSGRRAPHLPDPEPPVHAASIAAFVDRLRDLAGTPPEILADDAALTTLLPMLRADFAAAETYRYQPGRLLNCPISVFGGSSDRFAPVLELREWREHTRADCVVRVLNGGHFFWQESLDQVLSLVARDLEHLL